MIRVCPVASVAIALLLSGCRPAPPSPPQIVTTTRQVGAWQGTGNMTVGDVVNTAGHFLIRWETRAERPPGGHFRLTVHSAVSGRPLKMVVDHAGEGHGTVDFEDDPRVYQFFVDSANVAWSFTVDEVIGVAAPSKSP